jgi:hypothetical protein
METDKNIQHRPAHTGVFFDDAGRPVAGTPPHAEQTAEDGVLDSLVEIGASFPDPDRAAEIIAEAFDRHGDQRAGEALQMVLGNLSGGGKQGALLRAALLASVGLTDAESLAEQAAVFGVTKQTWHRAIQRLKERIFKNG